MMSREEFLKLCQHHATRRKNSAEWLEDVVEYEGVKYLPTAYVLSFSRQGVPIHTARLLSLNGKVVINVNLNEVERNEKKD